MNLEEIAGDLIAALEENRPDQADVRHYALCFAEEAGEFIGAYRRYAGIARRAGSPEEVGDELADVLITASTVAVALGIDIEEAVKRKLDKIYSRGWRE